MTAPRPAPAPSRRRWFLPAFVFLALAGALAAVFFLLGSEPEPVVVAVAVTQYDAPEWPPNPSAEQDARGFAERFPNPYLPFERQGKNGIVNTLREAAAEAKKGDRPLVVYFSALGTVTGDTAFLLPSDARADTEGGWLPLAEVLDPLRAAGVPTLLILDIRAARVPGQLFPTADVNERIDADLAALAASGDLPLTVLTANTPKTGPAVLYPLQGSLFGLATGHAVGGAADGWTPAGSKDGVVRVEEFTNHVVAATANGSKAFGGETQTPRVHRFGTGKDFRLTTVAKTGADPLPEPAAARAYPPILAEAWTAADEARAGGFHLRVPGRLRQFTTNAVRAEQRWLAGIGDAAVGQTLDPKPAAFKADVAERGPAKPAEVSIARFAKGATFADHGKPAVPLLRKALDLIAAPTPMTKDDLDKELAKVAADTTTPFDAVAAAAWDAARKLDAPTQEQFRFLLKVTAAHPARKPLAELATLELVAGLPPRWYAQWMKQEGTLRRVLDAAELAERAAAFDARYQPWLTKDLAAADKVRRDAMVALCDPEAATDAFRAAPAKLDEAGKSYTAVAATAEQFRRAWAVFEAARAGLDDLTTDGPPAPGPQPADWERSVREMADAYGTLETLLHPADGATAVVREELGRATITLNDRRESLTAARTLVSQAPSVRELERLLRWPGWTAARRAELRAELFKQAAAATARVLNGWPVEFKAVTVTAPKPPTAVPGESIRDLGIAIAEYARRSPDRAAGLELLTKFDATREKMADRAAFGPMVSSLARLRKTKPLAPPPPDTDLESHRAAERRYAAWLSTKRYEADAAALADCPFEAGFAPAKRLRDVAENCR